MYLIGKTITLKGSQKNNGTLANNPEEFIPKENNSTPLNFVKLYVEGDLVAFDNFQGV